MIISNLELDPDSQTPGVEIGGVRIAEGWTPGKVWIFAREGDGTEMDEAQLGDLLQEIARRFI